MKKNILFYCFLLCVTLLSAQHKATLIHKDANFYKVDDLLYRSEQLVNEDKEVIKNTNIKTIINLRYLPVQAIKKYLQIKKIFILLTIRCLRGASKPLK